MEKRENAYSFNGRIRYSEAGSDNRLTFPGLVNYFQDCSIFHSEHLGIGIDYLRKKHCAWILTYWQIEVNRYPKTGDFVRTSTWASQFKGFLGHRNFCMEDADGKDLAMADSLWVYLDMQQGRPVRPSQMEVDRYGVGDPLPMENLSRKIQMPEETREGPVFQVRRDQIDTNGHMNNCQYIQLAMEALGMEDSPQKVRVSYKKSAVYQDRLYARLSTEGMSQLVALRDENGTDFAVVEFS